MVIVSIFGVESLDAARVGKLIRIKLRSSRGGCIVALNYVGR